MGERTNGANFGCTIANQDIYEESSTQKHALGERLVLGDRVFRYAKSGGAITAAHIAVLATALVSEDTVTVAHPIGTYEVDVTASGVSANDYAEGYLCVDEGTGVGTTYKIRENDATGGKAGTGKVRIKLYDPIITAWSTSDTDVTIIKSPYNGVIVAPTDGICMPAGVPLLGITSGYYFWLQTWGPCGVKIDAASGWGNLITERVFSFSTNHAGQAIGSSTAGHGIVGWAMLDSADYNDDKVEPIYLTVCP